MESISLESILSSSVVCRVPFNALDSPGDVGDDISALSVSGFSVTLSLGSSS